jgi:hypothetical protein
LAASIRAFRESDRLIGQYEAFDASTDWSSLWAKRHFAAGGLVGNMGMEG